MPLLNLSHNQHIHSFLVTSDDGYARVYDLDEMELLYRLPHAGRKYPACYYDSPPPDLKFTASDTVYRLYRRGSSLQQIYSHCDPERCVPALPDWPGQQNGRSLPHN